MKKGLLVFCVFCCAVIAFALWQTPHNSARAAGKAAAAPTVHGSPTRALGAGPSGAGAPFTLKRYRPLGAALRPAPAASPRTAAPAAPGAETPNCRYGAVITPDPALPLPAAQQMAWLPNLRAGWYVDFTANPPPAATPAEHAAIIYTKQRKAGCAYLNDYFTQPTLTEDGLGQAIRARPGALWLVGNEPDRGPDPHQCDTGQDDIYPEMYARVYHDVYTFIKQRDPTARVANAGLVEVTPGRLQYLDKVWQRYYQLYGAAMPVDVWNMHLYVLPEALPDGAPNGIANIALGTDPALAMRESGGDAVRCADPQVYCYAEHDSLAIFAEQVRAMRGWMLAHGQRHKPLIISEYSLLLPYYYPNSTDLFTDEFGAAFTPARVTGYLAQTAAYLETATDAASGYPADGDRLVQQWMWFSVYYNEAGAVSNLVGGDLVSLSAVGQAFQQLAPAAAPGPNLRPVSVAGSAGLPPPPGETVTITLRAEILNQGSAAVSTPYTVTFYADSAPPQPIASTVITQSMAGCAMQPVTASARWGGRAPGGHDFWVQVDTGGVVGETDETDNLLAGSAFVGAHGAVLPLVSKP